MLEPSYSPRGKDDFMTSRISKTAAAPDLTGFKILNDREESFRFPERRRTFPIYHTERAGQAAHIVRRKLVGRRGQGGMDGLGERLKSRIKTLGLTDAEVARRAGLSETRFAHYVRDRREPDFVTFVRICRLLSTTPDALLAFDPSSSSEDDVAVLRDRLLAAASTMDESMLRTAVDVVTAMARPSG